MKTVVLAALAALPLSALAQQANDYVSFPDNGIYLSATDFSEHKLTDGFNDGQLGYRIHEETFQRALKVDQPNAPEAKFPLLNLWGDRKKGIDYRSFDGDLYRIEHTDRIYVYSRTAPSWMVTSGPAYSPTLYYFSREADSPIYSITSQNLEDIYYDQPDKRTAFDQLDDLNVHPSDQANHLVRLFYATDKPVHAAD